MDHAAHDWRWWAVLMFGVPFAATRLMHFYNGFVERGAQLQGDMKVGELCSRSGDLFARFSECPRYMTIGALTQMWSGCLRVWENTSPCIFVNCSDLVHELAFDIAIIAPCLILSLVAVYYLIVLGHKATNSIGSLESQRRDFVATYDQRTKPAPVAESPLPQQQQQHHLLQLLTAKGATKTPPRNDSGFEEVPLHWWNQNEATGK
jgi:hypothetical protein